MLSFATRSGNLFALVTYKKEREKEGEREIVISGRVIGAATTFSARKLDLKKKITSMLYVLISVYTYI